MMRAIVSVRNYEDGVKEYLKPYRFEIPSFVPSTKETAAKMAFDLDLGDGISFEGSVWIVDDSWPDSKGLHRMIAEDFDWSATEVLKYDFEEKNSYGHNRHDPWIIWNDVADNTIRAKGLEPFIIGDTIRSERYAKKLKKDQWAGFTEEELIQSPCWMFYYAKNVCGGRLSEVLDNAMTMLSFENSENPWIKRYFGTKKYRRRNKKALAAIGQVA